MKSKRGQRAIEAGGNTVTQDVTTEQVTLGIPAEPALALQVEAFETVTPAAGNEASVIEPDLRVIVDPESPMATVTQLPVTPAKDRISSLLERLERLEQGLQAVGERLDNIEPPDVRLVEAHDDPSRMSPWTARHAAAAALPKDGGSGPYLFVPDISIPEAETATREVEHVAAAVVDGPDYLPDEVFTRLQQTVAERLRQTKKRD